MRRMLVVLAACPLAACLMGPNYHRPAVEAPPAYRYAAEEARDTANAPWWTQFADPVLDGLVDDALAHNLNVQIAAANVEQAAAVLRQVRSPLYPQAGLRGERVRDAAEREGGAGLRLRGLAGASWEIDLWGRVRRLSESARAQVLATEEARLGVILSLVSGVANTTSSCGRSTSSW